MPAPFFSPAFRSRASLAVKISIPVVCTLITAWLVKAAVSHEAGGAHLAGALARVGPWAPAIFLALLMVRPVLLLPGQAFAALAGVIWGPAEGAALSLLGCALAMGVVTWLGRTLLQRPLRRWAGARHERLARIARRHDLTYAVLSTSNPLLPTDVCIAVGAAAGGRRLRLIAGALVGSAPGTFATTCFGHAVGRDQPVAMALSLVGLLASLVGGALLGRSILRGLGPAPARRGTDGF